MWLQTLCFIGALTVAAVPLAAGAQSLTPNFPWTNNPQTAEQGPQTCPPGWVWEPAGYLGGGKWIPGHCASRRHTIDF